MNEFAYRVNRRLKTASGERKHVADVNGPQESKNRTHTMLYRRRHILKGCLAIALVVLGADYYLSHANAAPQTQADAEDGVQVLTRGPVHEAFAETVTFDPEPGIIVPGMPPESIEELPPELRPEGENVAWIPGYFAWDEERSDFLWVSGIWRDLPPGRQWVPGYWAELAEGSQWISGYWADAALSELRYLPEPPATIEVGPNIEAPSVDHHWLPGCWIWHEDRYAWRPGYWAPVQPDWDWIPAHYVWSPRGYVFVDGYNDYSVTRRGVLFAPVFFSADIYSRSGYSYSPTTVINLAQFTSHLFSRPQYNHYYFGDYYAASYNNAGYYPWFSYTASGHGYDPFYARQRWQHRENSDWQHNLETDFGHRRDNDGARPARTLAAQIENVTNAADSDDENPRIAMSLEELTTSEKSTQRFETMDREERQKLGQRGQEIRKYRKERQQLEAKASVTSAENTVPGTPLAPEQVKLPMSPIAAKTDGTPGKNAKFPEMQETPELDLKVEPVPRTARDATRNPGAKKNEPKLPGGERKPPTKSGKSMDKPTIEPEPNKKVDPKPDRPKVDPNPNRPKADSKPDRPTADPKPDRPKVDPKPDRPKVDPKPDRPKVDPKPELPKVDPKPDRPKVDPNP